jgi:hypothetical protein
VRRLGRLHLGRRLLLRWLAISTKALNTTSASFLVSAIQISWSVRLALEWLFIVKIVLIGLDNVERCTERVGSHSKLYAHCELSL